MADEKNPYPEGSYRAKAWARRQADKAKENPPAEKEAPPPDDPKGRTYFGRGRDIDAEIDKADNERKKRNQSTDDKQ